MSDIRVITSPHSSNGFRKLFTFLTLSRPEKIIYFKLYINLSRLNYFIIFSDECEAKKTCNDNGECNSDGKCDCDDHFFGPECKRECNCEK